MDVEEVSILVDDEDDGSDYTDSKDEDFDVGRGYQEDRANEEDQDQDEDEDSNSSISSGMNIFHIQSE